MLNFFKKSNKILGVDSATNVVLRSIKNNIPAIPLFFSNSVAKKISNEWGKAKLIFGNNCIAHLNNLKDLMLGVKNLLSDDGVFVIECNYWGGMVKNTNYSLIYHDHFSYFSVKPWINFAKKYKMYPFDAIVTPAQGGSLRLFLSKKKLKRTKKANLLVLIIFDRLSQPLLLLQLHKFHHDQANLLKRQQRQLRYRPFLSLFLQGKEQFCFPK